MSQPPQKPKGNNLLSNISPPSELPSFITANVPVPPQPIVPVVSSTTDVVNPVPPSVISPVITNAPSTTQTNEPHLGTTFSAAIPPQNENEFNVNQPGVQKPVTSESNDSISSAFRNMTLNPNAVSHALEPITQGGANLFGWMKGAVSSGGILQKVAEKAKSSVDTIVTTLDPQMKDYIYSGGDLEVLVASDKDDKVRPIREAFQTVFGRATVTGIPAQPKSIAIQPMGYQNAVLGGFERIESVRSVTGPAGNLPIVAVENFIVELAPEEWYEGGIVMVSDLENNIDLKIVTQMTPIPVTVITTIKAETPNEYEQISSGYAVTVGQVMANNLRVHHSEWHGAYTTINRSDMILIAAKALAGLYKQELDIALANEAAAEGAAVAINQPTEQQTK